VAVGLAVTFTAGLPLVGQSTVTAVTNITNTFGTERKNTTETEDSIEARIEVPPLNKRSFSVSMVKESHEIPWTAKAVTIYRDGSESLETIRGTSITLVSK